MRVILASGSPRRRELLSLLFPQFEVVAPAGIDEDSHLSYPYAESVQRLAAAKADQVARVRPECLVIGADTVVVCDEEVLGKPCGPEDAARMLRMLSGREHTVMTGVAVSAGGVCATAVEATAVTFDTLAETDISAYLATGEPMDKAGAYGIQGYASRFIPGIRGCYFNVVGLPIYRLARLLEQTGLYPAHVRGMP